MIQNFIFPQILRHQNRIRVAIVFHNEVLTVISVRDSENNKQRFAEVFQVYKQFKYQSEGFSEKKRDQIIPGTFKGFIPLLRSRPGGVLKDEMRGIWSQRKDGDSNPR